MATATGTWEEATVREFELYDEGLYMAQIVDVSKTDPNQYGIQGCWKLEFPDIEREDQQPVYLNFYTPTDITAKNKFGALLMACRRPLPEPGATFKPKSLVGEWIQARIVHYQRKSDGQLGCKVSEVMQLTPKQRKSITLSMPGEEPEVEEDETPAAKSNAAAAAITAGENAKAAAVGELQPLLVALAESDVKLGKSNTGPGLIALLKAAKAQGANYRNLDFALVSMSDIEQATAEVKKLLGIEEDADDDIFVDE